MCVRIASLQVSGKPLQLGLYCVIVTVPLCKMQATFFTVTARFFVSCELSNSFMCLTILLQTNKCVACPLRTGPRSLFFHDGIFVKVVVFAFDAFLLEEDCQTCFSEQYFGISGAVFRISSLHWDCEKHLRCKRIRCMRQAFDIISYKIRYQRATVARTQS